MSPSMFLLVVGFLAFSGGIPLVCLIVFSFQEKRDKAKTQKSLKQSRDKVTREIYEAEQKAKRFKTQKQGRGEAEDESGYQKSDGKQPGWKRRSSNQADHD